MMRAPPNPSLLSMARIMSPLEVLVMRACKLLDLNSTVRSSFICPLLSKPSALGSLRLVVSSVREIANMNQHTLYALSDELEKIARSRWLKELSKSEAPKRLTEYGSHRKSISEFQKSVGESIPAEHRPKWSWGREPFPWNATKKKLRLDLADPSTRKDALESISNLMKDRPENPAMMYHAGPAPVYPKPPK